MFTAWYPKQNSKKKIQYFISFLSLNFKASKFTKRLCALSLYFELSELLRGQIARKLTSIQYYYSFVLVDSNSAHLAIG